MSGFGQPNAFGSSNNNNNGGFGNSSSAGQFSSSGSAGFGSSTFGQQPQTQQPFGVSASAATAGFGGFGTPTSTNTSAASSMTTGFGATPFGGGGTPSGGATGFGGTSSSGFGTSSGGGFGSSATNTGGGAFGSSVNNVPTTSTSSAAAPSSFGFGQQQQQQQQMGFGSSSNNNSNNFGGGGTANTTSAAPIMAFGSSSTVLATPQHQQHQTQQQQQPTTTSFGSNNASTSGFGTASTTANNAGFGASTSAGFGASTSTGFGTSNTTGFSSSSTGFGASNTTTSSTTTGFGASNTTATPSSSSFASSQQQQPPPSNLSVNATPFAPSSSTTAASTTSSGFGMSSSTGATNNAFGSGGFGASGQGGATISAAPPSSTAFGVGGAFGSQTTAASSSTSSSFGNTACGGSDNSSSFPFGARIPRKEKPNISPNTTAAATATATNTADNETVPDGGGDAQLAALRAKIQEKKQKLLDKKKAQQQQQQMSPSRTSAATTSTSTTATDNDRNAELAAKNALRFASQQDNKGLSSLLPTDLQNAAASYTPSAGDGGNDDANDVNDIGDEGDDDDLVNSNNNRNVNNAKSLIGICKSMCPDEELLRREREGDIQLLEITDPGGLHPSHWTLRDTAVKRFRRSAADFKLDIPELVRPPEVLERVCGYLEEWVMERDRQGPDKRWAQAATTTSDTPPPLDVYQFIWDRTRMIRKDFILQNYIGTGGKCDARAVRCHERIARWHAMCEHQLSHIPDFVKHQSQQNIAELGQTMKTLNLYYDDALGRALTEPASSGGECLQGCASDIVMGKIPIDFDGSTLSNDAQSADVSQRIVGKNGNSPSLGTAEPEMRGLYILLTMNNEGGMEVLKYSGRLCTQKPEIFYSKPVQLALTIFQAKKDHNYAKFFRLLRCPSTPYLFSCIMFKYVENMRKETLMLMSKVYGARHKTTGEAFFDSYPLERLVKLLCYEDESEASEACRHYGITVEGDQVLWRHSKFREPRDPEKGIIIPLKPRKMIRTIESKLNGATRLSVCRGGVSGEGATLSKASTSVDADLMLKERQKAQEEMKKKLAEAKAREEAERLKQEKIKEERLRQERLEAEKRAKEEAAKRAEQERIRKEQLEKERLEREKQERERIAAEEKARKEAAERAERLRREKKAREKKEREIAEAKRLAEEERKRKLAEEERMRRLEEEKRRQEEEERRRIARELELKRKAEEERIRKAKEEEERRIEMAWREKVENAKKLLICRLLRKHMRKHDSVQKSRNSLSKLDPTCTQYPMSAKHQVSRDLFCNTTSSTEAITRRIGSDVDELENQMYRLATAPRQQMDLSKLVQDCIAKSCNSYQPNESYPSVVRPAGPVKLFKLAILLPTKSEQCEHLHDTLRMWVQSHLELDEVFSSMFSIRTFQVVFRTVAVIGNEDVSNCKGCDAVLVLLPSFTGETVRTDFSEKALEFLEQNIPRMVLVLDTMDVSRRSAPADMTVKWIDSILGDGLEDHPSDLQQREGVAAPNSCDFDLAFCKCCQVLVQAHIETTRFGNNESSNSIVRISLSDLGFLCLQRLIQNMDESGFFHSFSPPTSSYVTLFDMCKNTLSSLSHQLSTAQEEMHQQWQQGCSGWPSKEFFTSERGIESFFGKNYDLPFDWHEPKSNLGNELKLFFQHLLERTTLTLFVQSVVDSLHDGVGQDLLLMLENGEVSSCFSTIVSMVVDGEINLVSSGQQTILYLPTNTLTSMIERVAAYELPESEPNNEIPDYLIWGLPVATTTAAANFEEEEKENNQLIPTPKNDEVAATATTTATPLMESKDKSITSYKRRFSDHIMTEPNLEEEKETGRNDNRQKSVKRTKLDKISTEEERSSKSFTSYLEALLGDV